MIWQQIDTAPHDGTAILLWPFNPSNIYGRAALEVCLGFCHEGDWFREGDSENFEPSHWMLLPTPPKIT